MRAHVRITYKCTSFAGGLLTASGRIFHGRGGRRPNPTPNPDPNPNPKRARNAAAPFFVSKHVHSELRTTISALTLLVTKIPGSFLEVSPPNAPLDTYASQKKRGSCLKLANRDRVAFARNFCAWGIDARIARNIQMIDAHLMI